MKETLVLILVTIVFPFFAFAQYTRPSIDTGTFRTWPTVQDPVISNNGQYISYSVYNLPVGDRTLIIQSIKNNARKKEFTGGHDLQFSGDNKYAIFQKGKDSLCILELLNNDVIYISNVSSWQMPEHSKDAWLAYRSNTIDRELVLFHLESAEKKCFLQSVHYLVSKDGKGMFVLHEMKKDSIVSQALQWITPEGLESTIWSDSNQKVIPGSWVIDPVHMQMAFLTQLQRKGATALKLYLYQIGSASASCIVEDSTNGIAVDLQLANSLPQFNKDGRIFFRLQERETKVPDNNLAMVNVWNYLDAQLQPLQLTYLKLKPALYLATISNVKAVIQLETEFEEVVGQVKDIHGAYVLIKKQTSSEYWWDTANRPTIYCMSLEDGNRKYMKRLSHFTESVMLSPDNHFFVSYDCQQKAWFSKELTTGKTANISKEIPYSICNDQIDEVVYESFGIAGWLVDDKAVLLYDQFDIWQVDLNGSKPPVNITKGYGRAHKVILGIPTANETNLVFSKKQPLLLGCYSRVNKQNGFGSLIIGKEPVVYKLDSYVYFISRISPGGFAYPRGRLPVKARDANIWLVTRMSAREAPNFFSTTDFKNFLRQSEIRPELSYNWLTVELHTWQMDDGKMSQGILYKPENFDPAKKYPVIFDYYERRSDELQVYIRPSFSSDRINIPYFVSNGYLVFVPDIYYTLGKGNGEGALNAVVSAARHLSSFPWIDSNRLALQGHSFGGYQTNYLITHTNIFAAACEAAGSSDLASSYGQLSVIGTARQMGYEIGWQGCGLGLGKTPWTDPDLYVAMSPVFNIHKITTPLLMMHCRKDGAVPFEQAVEMFIGMRRAGKKVWMLEYDNGGHSLWGKDAADYTVRMKQFFDHYLQGAPEPKWMAIGIPARLKGVETGLELTNGSSTARSK